MIWVYIVRGILDIPKGLLALVNVYMGQWTMPVLFPDVVEMIGRALWWWNWILPIGYILSLVAIWFSLDVGLFVYDLVMSGLAWVRGTHRDQNAGIGAVQDSVVVDHHDHKTKINYKGYSDRYNKAHYKKKPGQYTRYYP